MLTRSIFLPSNSLYITLFRSARTSSMSFWLCWSDRQLRTCFSDSSSSSNSAGNKTHTHTHSLQFRLIASRQTQERLQYRILAADSCVSWLQMNSCFLVLFPFVCQQNHPNKVLIKSPSSASHAPPPLLTPPQVGMSSQHSSLPACFLSSPPSHDSHPHSHPPPHLL